MMEGNVDGAYIANKHHYEAKYSTLDTSELVQKASNLTFFHEAIRGYTSWFTLYLGDFEKRLRGKTVLELGAGDGVNALVMARLGARVTALEISSSAVDNLSRAADHLGLDVTAACGNFLEMDLPELDYVVGKAFLHHVTHEMEDQVLRKVSALLRSSGEARFCEPAVNSRMLDTLRWLVPVGGRPSSLNRAEFTDWQRKDPHPDRSNSSSHYSEAAAEYFDKVEIVPVGGIERFRRLIRNRQRSEAFGRWALHLEQNLVPRLLHLPVARCQLIVMSSPK